jgi:GGDEF domain-containing protein
VARHGEDSIGVLLPETTVDQAALLAMRFREMVQHGSSCRTPRQKPRRR